MSFFFNQSQKSQQSSISNTPFFQLNTVQNYSIFNSNVKEQNQRQIAYNMFNCIQKEDAEQKQKSIIQKLDLFQDDDEILQMISKNRHLSNVYFDNTETNQGAKNEIVDQEKFKNATSIEINKQSQHANQIKAELNNIQPQNSFKFNNNLTNFSLKNQLDYKKGFKEIETAPIHMKQMKQTKKDREQKQQNSNIKIARTENVDNLKQKNNSLFQEMRGRQSQKNNIKFKLTDLLRPRQLKKSEAKPSQSLEGKTSGQVSEEKETIRLNSILKESKVTPYPKNDVVKQQNKEKPRSIFQLNLRRSRVLPENHQEHNKYSLAEKINLLKKSKVDSFQQKFLALKRNQTPKLEDSEDKKAIDYKQECKQLEKTFTKQVSNESSQFQKIAKNEENVLTSKQKANYINKKKQKGNDVIKISLQQIRNELNRKTQNDSKDPQYKQFHKFHLEQQDNEQKQSISGLSNRSSAKKEQSVGLKEQLKKLGGRKTEKLQIKSIAPFKFLQLKSNLQLKKKQFKFQSFQKTPQSKNLDTQDKKQPILKIKIENPQNPPQKPKTLLFQKRQTYEQQGIINKQSNAKVSSFSKYMIQLMDLQKQFELLKLRSYHIKNSYRQLAILNDDMNKRIDGVLQNSYKMIS